MKTWVLIIAIYWGSPAVTSVSGFTSAESCRLAAERIDKFLMSGDVICIQQ